MARASNRSGSQPPMAPVNRPVDEQRPAFERYVLTNPVVREILPRARSLDLPQWYLTAGCLFQTVWNVLSGNEPTRHIRDYDLLYFDDRDLSWEAENTVIQRCAEVFSDLGVEVEARNEARVHLWYESRFGVPCPPYTSTEAAINSFAATTCCVGIRLDALDRLIVYAPYGFNDLYGFVLRPNPIVAPAQVYEAKAARWKEQWPVLTVMPWPTR